MKKFALSIPVKLLTYKFITGFCYINGCGISVDYTVDKNKNKKRIQIVRPWPEGRKILRYNMGKPIVAGDVIIKGGVMNEYYALLICETQSDTIDNIEVSGGKIFEFKEGEQMDKSELCEKICSLARKEKDQDVYFLLGNHTFMTGDEMRKVYLLYFGYPFEGTNKELALWATATYNSFNIAWVYFSDRIYPQQFLQEGNFELAREFCRKEYKDPDEALRLDEELIKDMEKDKVG